MSGKNKAVAQQVGNQINNAGNLGVNDPVLPCKKNNDPQLLVKVFCNDGKKKYIHANVKAGAAGNKNTIAKTGVADYSYVNVGDYTIEVQSFLDPDDKDYCLIDASTVANITLNKGDKRTVELLVDKKNVVTPKLELEYKVVLLDPDLAKYQDNAEPKKFYASPTYVQVSISETNNAYPYDKGAKLICTPANVDMFLDEACTQATDGNFSNAQLPVGTDLKVYFKGKTKGKFTAKLELNDPANAKISIKDPVEEKMGVVKLEMKLYQYDIPAIQNLRVNPDVTPIKTYHDELKNLELPDQIELSDQNKVKGRLLHVQDKLQFARAKLVIKQYTDDDWPDGTDSYEFSLTTESAADEIAIHGKEWKDNFIKLVKIKVSDLKKKEHEYWVEGKNATTPPYPVLYALGLNRAAGGLAHTTKNNADWIRFTVVKINTVSVEYTAPVNAPATWNAGDKRFYINFQAGDAGRKVKIRAQLSQQLKDVPIYFMLAADKNNQKKANWGEDLPGTWVWKDINAALKHKDKNDRTHYLHLSAQTNANGFAECELTLSQFGGDQFYPAAYVEQDPHLAKYVRGNTDLEKKKPILADNAITVWRKFWYQVTKEQGLAIPDPNATVAAYKAIFTEMQFDQTVEFNAGTAPANTFYPEFQLKVGSNSNTQVAVIGSENKTTFANFLVQLPAQPIKRHLIVCIYQCDLKPVANGQSEAIDSDMAGQWIDLLVNGNGNYVLDPPLQGGSMIDELYWYRSSTPGVHTNIPAANARIPNPRRRKAHIQVQVPAINPVPDAADPVFIVAACHTAKNYLGESYQVRHTLAVYDADDETDYFDTITHEFGHSYNQTPRAGTQPGSPNIPNHPTMADAGQGNHCRVNKGVSGTDTKYICVMYDSGPMKWGLHKFCKTCHPYLLVEDFHKP